MVIYWLGHASFLIDSPSGRILTDPFDKQVGYPQYKEPVDIVTVSHQHYDHNAVEGLQGNPQVISQPGIFQIGPVRIEGIESFHDRKQGKLRGKNIIYKISLEGLDIVHLGDLGHILETRQIEAIGNVDILLLPVGGIYTIDAHEAKTVAEQLKPVIIVPMHYKTKPLTIELDPLEKFTGQFDKTVKRPWLKVSREDLHESAGVIVLDYPGS
ncbi:MAG: MBL fold metallo-hydrolase [Syntrophomonadaceae bacterium]|jgi:L-ascorbate metabolism protein UlaG (beta-lactamase superfamily)|nr:MBL fold metallo-hydrolase [Syntrophomonadaceae bacterium]